MKAFIIILTVLLFNISCINKSTKYDVSNKTEVESIVEETNNQKEHNDTNKSVLFETKDLENMPEFSLEEFAKKFNLSKGNNMYGEHNSFINLGLQDNNLIIIKACGDENTMYYLGNVMSSELPNYTKAIDVTLHWSEPWEGGAYRNKEFKIYKDYLIYVKTEECFEEKKIYENYYRINDKGEFYEVKE